MNTQKVQKLMEYTKMERRKKQVSNKTELKNCMLFKWNVIKFGNEEAFNRNNITLIFWVEKKINFLLKIGQGILIHG